MLNKYKFITIMEGEFCKIIIYKICVSNQNIIQMNNLITKAKFGGKIWWFLPL
jgi:hypothetical protein